MKIGSLITSKLWHYPSSESAFFTQTEYSAHQFSPHFHDHYAFFSVKKGVNEGGFKRKKYTITPADFLIIHPGEIHSGNSHSGRLLTYLSFCPTEKFLMNATESMELVALPSFEAITSNAEVIVQKFETFVKASSVNSNGFLLEQSLTDFLGSLIEEISDKAIVSTQKQVYNEKIKLARKYIEENHTQNFSLAELSRYTGLSPFHLLRSFKKCVGLTPHSYLHNFRIEMAKKKIYKQSSLTHLAYETGFYDQSHFIRHFKKINGVSPSVFKQ